MRPFLLLSLSHQLVLFLELTTLIEWQTVRALLSNNPRPSKAAFVSPRSWSEPQAIRRISFGSSTELYMVFDFLRERSQEGLDELGKLGDAFKRGQLRKGLQDAAAYAAQTNQAFAAGLAKSRARLLENLDTLLTGVSPEDLIDDLIDILIQADLGLSTAEDIANEVRSLRRNSEEVLSKNDLKSIMRGKLIEALDTGNPRAIQFSSVEEQPTVLFIMGANGMGKTTTIGKLAYRLRSEANQTVLLAACDTFRAGAVDQLQQWADRAKVDLVGPSEIAKTPSEILAVALDKAKAERYDTLLVDTSGRLSNNYKLTDELVEMKQVIQKKLSVEKHEITGQPILNAAVPHETLLVLDSAQGRMALDSAKVWNEEVGLTGLILTKLDGTARGGSAVSISRDLELPIKLVGVGEDLEDLRDFNPESFVDGLLGIGAAGGKGASNEGAMLAARLATMRKERDQRAVELKKQQMLAKKLELQAVSAGAPEFSLDSSELDNPRNAASKAKSNNKKKKKKKNR